MGLSIGFFAIFALFGSIDYATVFSLGSFMNETAITIIGLLLLTGAMAKSSQIPLHSWLPGSMEGGNYKFFKGYTFLSIFRQIFLFIFLFIFIIIFNYVDFTELTHCNNFYTMSMLPFHFERDSNGRFKGKSLPFVPLDAKLIEALTGELLGDGHLRFNKKNSDGKPNPKTGKPTTHYHFSSKALKSISKIHSEWYQWCEK